MTVCLCYHNADGNLAREVAAHIHDTTFVPLGSTDEVPNSCSSIVYLLTFNSLSFVPKVRALFQQQQLANLFVLRLDPVGLSVLDELVSLTQLVEMTERPFGPGLARLAEHLRNSSSPLPPTTGGARQVF